jgi:Uncharacterized conserved protein
MITEIKPILPENIGYKDLIEMYSEELGILQREAKELEIPFVIVFEGWYDIFIGEIINRQLIPLDSRGFDFYYTDAPTSEENRKPFIFRFSQKMPPRDKIAIFDRSWYMRGLIEYLLNESVFGCPNLKQKNDLEMIFTEPASEEIIGTPKFNMLIETINDFEKTLSDSGVQFIKIYFGARKEKRIESQKHWQNLIPYDIDKRSTEAIYKKDVRVIKEVLKQTNMPYAPWNLYFVEDDLDLATARTMKIIKDQMESVICEAKLRKEKSTNPINSISPINTEKPNHSDSQHLITGSGTLDKIDLSKTCKESEYKKKLGKYQKELAAAHYSLYLNKKPMVLVFEGWDASGKGGGIKRIVQSMNPRYYRVIPIGSPTDVDLKYHYLWRFLNGIPSCGKTSIYDRSWYGRVMVERIEKYCSEDDWQRAYSEINSFEKAMTESGIIVIKFWLHISKEEQYKRFMERSADPAKQWKLTEEDWRNRDRWDEYYTAVNEMIEKTDTEKAPWVIIEANDKHYARIKILKTVIERIEKELGDEIKETEFSMK